MLAELQAAARLNHFQQPLGNAGHPCCMRQISKNGSLTFRQHHRVPVCCWRPMDVRVNLAVIAARASSDSKATLDDEDRRSDDADRSRASCRGALGLPSASFEDRACTIVLHLSSSFASQICRAGFYNWSFCWAPARRCWRWRERTPCSMVISELAFPAALDSWDRLWLANPRHPILPPRDTPFTKRRHRLWIDIVLLRAHQACINFCANLHKQHSRHVARSFMKSAQQSAAGRKMASAKGTPPLLRQLGRQGPPAGLVTRRLHRCRASCYTGNVKWVI